MQRFAFVLIESIALIGCPANSESIDTVDPGPDAGLETGPDAALAPDASSSDAPAMLGPHQAPPFVVTDTTDGDLDGVADQLETYLISQFAPEIRLPPDDKDWTRPANVNWYLANVRMGFHHDNCPDHGLLPVGGITFDNIWRQMHETSSTLCLHTDTILTSGPVGATFTQHKEFYLEAEDEQLVHAGIPPVRSAEWRMYAHVKPSSYVRASDGKAAAYDIQTWFFFPYNDAIGDVNHEGDWEHITVSVTADFNFVSAFYATHNAGDRWDSPLQLEWVGGTHPVGYSADGTHATYRSAGEHPGPVVPDYCYDGGPKWQTWSNFKNLGERGKVLDQQVWAKYAGRWGEIGAFDFTSGPVGPMYNGKWNISGSEY